MAPGREEVLYLQANLGEPTLTKLMVHLGDPAS